MILFRHQEDLDRSLDRLVNLAPELGNHRQTCEPIALRQRPAGLRGLLQIILAQQVSVASARAITERFEARFPNCDAQALFDASEEDLRDCSLSRPKIRTVQAIAQRILDGFDMDDLATLSAGEAKSALVGLHGVGPWTADIYLLFCLGHVDVFPAGDLALQVAVAHVLGTDERPKEKALDEMAKRLWSPERGAAAHLFWAIYRDLKSGKDGVL